MLSKLLFRLDPHHFSVFNVGSDFLSPGIEGIDNRLPGRFPKNQKQHRERNDRPQKQTGINFQQTFF